MKQKSFFILLIILTPMILLVILVSGLVSAKPELAYLSTTILYDGNQNNLPTDQGFSFTSIPAGPSPTITNGGSVLNTITDTGYYAGFASNPGLMPNLDRTAGFSVTFNVAVVTETHNNHQRAGFSVILLSQFKNEMEPIQGIELGFWTDEIWAQDDDTMGGTLFTHAEGVSFDTTQLTLYNLVVFTNTYTLMANGTPILNGRVRNYMGFAGFPDPYETPNFFFLGDDTSSAAAKLLFSYAAVQSPLLDKFIYLPIIKR